jgi:transglutaminase-like putative cysteine protease
VKVIRKASFVNFSSDLSILGYDKVDSWRRNSVTDLPECYSQLYFTVLNRGTILHNLSWTTMLKGSLINFKIGTLVTGYNTVSGVAILSEYEDFGIPYNLRVYLTAPTSAGYIYTYSEHAWTVNFPRYMPLEIASLYITPNNLQVKNLFNEITATPSILPVWYRLNNWIYWNIHYRDDSEAHGMRDYWQLPHETINLRTGDCEDKAILLCSLLRLAGYDENSVFVIVGYTSTTGHAWVRVNIGGIWTDLDPTNDPIGVIGGLISWAIFQEAYKFNDKYFEVLK